MTHHDGHAWKQKTDVRGDALQILQVHNTPNSMWVKIADSNRVFLITRCTAVLVMQQYVKAMIAGSISGMLETLIKMSNTAARQLNLRPDGMTRQCVLPTATGLDGVLAFCPGAVACGKSVVHLITATAAQRCNSLG